MNKKKREHNGLDSLTKCLLIILLSLPLSRVDSFKISSHSFSVPNIPRNRAPSTIIEDKKRRACDETLHPSLISRELKWNSAFRIKLNQNSRLFLSNDSPSTEASDSPDVEDDAIDVDSLPALYRVRISRAPGIEWGTDLSFSFVYVRTLEPAGDADLSGMVSVGDQLCEMRPILADGAVGKAIGMIGAPFDVVMNSFAILDRSIRDYELVFFRGSKKELIAACNNGGNGEESNTVTITVIQNKGTKEEKIVKLSAAKGANVRQALADADINVYQSVTRWTNCAGKQLCGTCIVNIADGGCNTNRKSHDEGSTLRENPDGYRLSCVTFAYGDVTVETYPPIKAAQWTR
mmetsp:Transcript_55692/g.67143  ORF Transcript_55692/g.67143 Transcript_55692/m.67143 type:complete len:348 (-) Transcript_55692:294-1337(-)|eukprot:CAMPEP_0194356980 /NCGR_PEP_ID=MMETSP0174-20130528/4532_1 /TAXON_ID=216777 /ORGANISM="Proboscia alata, Strain PI-D3" /LENGTH=347 /DNA_ID=CAMNT_0039126805 /DNA_START=72 /DNA_END=1115 /DNA_ORIENTATION=+